MNQSVSDLQSELTTCLQALSYPAWIRLVSELLGHLGYEDIKPSARTDKQGRHREGGCDLTATRLLDGGSRHLVVQAKQYPLEQPIARRMIDELRGVCLRSRAAEGILITTGSVSQGLVPRRLASLPLLPIRLIDGESLVALLIAHRLGVWEETNAFPDTPPERGVDLRYFAELEEQVAHQPVAVRFGAALSLGKPGFRQRLRPAAHENHGSSVRQTHIS